MIEKVRGYAQDEGGRCVLHNRAAFCQQCTDLVGRDNARLPSADQINANARECLEAAYRQLEEALSWLRSDHAPVGSDLTARQIQQRQAMRSAINTAKTALDDGQWL